MRIPNTKPRIIKNTEDAIRVASSIVMAMSGSSDADAFGCVRCFKFIEPDHEADAFIDADSGIVVCRDCLECAECFGSGVIRGQGSDKTCPSCKGTGRFVL